MELAVHDKIAERGFGRHPRKPAGILKRLDPKTSFLERVPKQLKMVGHRDQYHRLLSAQTHLSEVRDLSDKAGDIDVKLHHMATNRRVVEGLLKRVR
jgi:hypothetical protein